MSFLIETYVPKPDKNIDIISNFGSDTLIFTITQIVYTRDKFTLSLEAINKDDAEGDDAKIEVDLFHGKEPDTRNLVSGSINFSLRAFANVKTLKTDPSS